MLAQSKLVVGDVATWTKNACNNIPGAVINPDVVMVGDRLTVVNVVSDIVVVKSEMRRTIFPSYIHSLIKL